MRAQLERGDTSGAQGCMDIADRMRARQQPAASVVQPARTVAPLHTVAQTEQAGAHISVWPSSSGRSMFVGLDGVIARGDAQRFLAAVREGRAKYPNAAWGAVFLNSPGGIISDAAIIAAVGESGVPVVVPRGAMCASACFLIFANAKVKLASRAARIGVHSVIDSATGKETVGAKATTTELARACAEIGVPPSIIGRMVTTPPGRMAWLSESELTELGVRFIPAQYDD